MQFWRLVLGWLKNQYYWINLFANEQFSCLLYIIYIIIYYKPNFNIFCEQHITLAMGKKDGSSFTVTGAQRCGSGLGAAKAQVIN